MNDTIGSIIPDDHDETDGAASPLTVHEAAERLGITPDAVRARIRRGALHGWKEGNLWRVSLSSQTTRHDTEHDVKERVARHDAGPSRGTTPASLTAPRDYLRHLEDEVAYLRAELAKRSHELATERERADVLQREALGRIEAIEASHSGPDAPQAETRAPDTTRSGDLLARLMHWVQRRKL